MEAADQTKTKREKSPAAPAPNPAKPEPKHERDEELAKEIQEVRWRHQHQEEYIAKLLQNIKAQLPQLEKLLAETEDHWGMEDGVYRFYHQSFKVYYLQNFTEAICKALTALLPDRPMNTWFLEIVNQGTGHKFDPLHNEDWTRHTRPIMEALFHAHYLLKIVCKYGRELETPPNAMPSGWALVQYLFKLR